MGEERQTKQEKKSQLLKKKVFTHNAELILHSVLACNNKLESHFTHQ